MMNSRSIWTLKGVLIAIALIVTACGGPPTATPPVAPKAQPTAPSSALSSSDTQYQKVLAAEVGRKYPQPDKPKKAYKIGFAMSSLANSHFVAQAWAATMEAKALGATLTVADAGGYTNLEKQIAQIEDFVANKMDAILLIAINPDGTKDVVNRAVAAGIPVVNVNVMTASDKVVTRIRSDDVEMGKLQGQYMAKALNGKGNVVLLAGAPGTSWSIDRPNGFKGYVKDYPNIKILAEQFPQNSVEAALKVMEDYLQAYPQIDGVFNGSAPLATGAAQAVSAAGKKSKTVITSNDFLVETEQGLRNGTIDATVVQTPVVMGMWGVRAAINTLEGRQVPKELFTPLLLATKDDLDKVQLELVRPPDGWVP